MNVEAQEPLVLAGALLGDDAACLNIDLSAEGFQHVTLDAAEVLPIPFRYASYHLAVNYTVLPRAGEGAAAERRQSPAAPNVYLMMTSGVSAVGCIGLFGGAIVHPCRSQSALIPSFDDEPLALTTRCDYGVVDHGPPGPLFGQDVIYSGDPYSPCSGWPVRDSREQGPSRRSVPARIAVAAQVDRQPGINEFLQPVAAAKSCLPDSQALAFLGFEARRRCPIVGLPIDADVPSKHTVSRAPVRRRHLLANGRISRP